MRDLIVFILDRSSSMGSMRQEAIDGYNQFVKDQLEVADADIQLVLFNTERTVAPMTKLSETTPLGNATFVPYSMTALYDAIGITIDEVGATLAARPENERPSKVIFAILTDGHENSSQIYPGEEGRQKVAEKIQHQQDVYNWQFTFLGANMDAKAVAVGMNIPADNAFTYVANAVGMTTAHAANSSFVRQLRTS